MGTGRVEAFSDGVIAVIITIMVLELKVPTDSSRAALETCLPSFLVYALSFVVVAIMWVNHHALLHAAKHSHPHLLWANNFLLFWMSLVPFVTAYMGRYFREPMAVGAYGFVLTLTSVGFFLLRRSLIDWCAADPVQQAVFARIQRKVVFSTSLYLASIPLAFVNIYFSFGIFVVMPLLYFVPERVPAPKTSS